MADLWLNPDGGAGLVDAAQSHRKIIPLQLHISFYYPF